MSNITYDRRAQATVITRANTAREDAAFNASVDSGMDLLRAFVVHHKIELVAGSFVGLVAFLALSFIGG